MVALQLQKISQQKSLTWGRGEHGFEDFTDILSLLGTIQLRLLVVRAEAHPIPSPPPLFHMACRPPPTTAPPQTFVFYGAISDWPCSLNQLDMHANYLELKTHLPITNSDARGRAEDPALLTSLSAKIDRCMGRIDSLETELGTSKKIMGGAILTLVSRVKKFLGHDKLLFPPEDIEGTAKEEEFHAPRSTDVLPHADISESAGPSVGADKGKAPFGPRFWNGRREPGRYLRIEHSRVKRLKQSVVTKMMRNLELKISDVRLIMERLEMDHLLSALFHPAGSATPMSGSAVTDRLSLMESTKLGFSFAVSMFLVLGCWLWTTSQMIEIVVPKDVDVGLDLWRDINLLCQSLHSDDVEDFWRTQDEWVVSDLSDPGSTAERLFTSQVQFHPHYCGLFVLLLEVTISGIQTTSGWLAGNPYECLAFLLLFDNDKTNKHKLPLKMLELKLETEEESSMALELIKFVKQQLEEFEDSNDDDTVTSAHEEAERVLEEEDPLQRSQCHAWSKAKWRFLETTGTKVQATVETNTSMASDYREMPWL
ncbi:hypothetical protein Tco_0730135 [Tanacetum coccineum]|uniref:Uncharacterized protein n=1 Tax=Tanacetum coccineum TaxID=301880 RepID=A0ABQ4YQW5_9ASTR